MRKRDYVLITAVAIIAVAGSFVTVFKSITTTQAASFVTAYYYTDAIIKKGELGDPDKIVPRMSGELQTGEKFETVYSEGIPDGFYILKVTAPANRHSALFGTVATKLSDDLDGLRSLLASRADLSLIRSDVHAEWSRLREQGCIVPIDPLLIVEPAKGSIKC